MQYTIRLLLPEGSLLLDHADLAPYLGRVGSRPTHLRVDAGATRRWTTLQQELATLVEDERGARRDPSPRPTRSCATRSGCLPVDLSNTITDRPHLTESWFCCAEPTDTQLKAVTTMTEERSTRTTTSR